MDKKTAAYLSIAASSKIMNDLSQSGVLKSGYPPGKKNKPRPKIKKKNYVKKRKKKSKRRK